MTPRQELTIISDWIPQGSTVLDLGCGDGALLAHLEKRGVRGYGLEIDEDNLAHCFRSGLNVIKQDIDEGLDNITTQRFDFVLMTQALQAVHRPDQVLTDMLRAGREAVVTFPNFGHWRVRAYLALIGRMPLSENLPYQWYDTPNIHMCTVRDFELFCQENDVTITERIIMNRHHKSGWLARLFPNVFGETAIYRVTR